MTMLKFTDYNKYEVAKEMEISACHKLNLPYESGCTRWHGHNYYVVVYVGCDELTPEGMVIDFAHLKREIHSALDHNSLNDTFDFNPTAENMAKWICDKINTMREGVNCFRVEVEETRNNVAVYNNFKRAGK